LALGKKIISIDRYRSRKSETEYQSNLSKNKNRQDVIEGEYKELLLQNQPFLLLIITYAICDKFR